MSRKTETVTVKRPSCYIHVFIYFQMLHVSQILKMVHFQNIWKEHLSQICDKPLINCPDSVLLAEPAHSEALSTGVRRPNQSKADMLFALSSLNK